MHQPTVQLVMLDITVLPEVLLAPLVLPELPRRLLEMAFALFAATTNTNPCQRKLDARCVLLEARRRLLAMIG